MLHLKTVYRIYTKKEKALSLWQLPYFILHAYSSSSLNYFLIHLLSTFSPPNVSWFQLHCLIITGFVHILPFIKLNITFRLTYSDFKISYAIILFLLLWFCIQIMWQIFARLKLAILSKYSFNSEHKCVRALEWAQVATTLTFRVFFFLRSRVDTNFVNYPYLRNPLSSKHVCMQ